MEFCIAGLPLLPAICKNKSTNEKCRNHTRGSMERHRRQSHQRPWRRPSLPRRDLLLVWRIQKRGNHPACAKAAWSVRQLERQINTMYYQRILASQDKIAVANEIQITEPKPEYEKIVKDPYVMEFLQIQPDTHVYEGDLEQALIDHLQHFLLELGRGFSFVARQKRFTLDGQDFFIDLVFYNYILKCFVLIDLKMGKLTHQDLGQMQMYVN